MTQTYPAVLPSTLKVTDGTALFNPTPTNATLATNPGAVFHPNVWSERKKAHPGSSTFNTAGWENIAQTPADPDFTDYVLVSAACNMPY